MSQSSIDVKLNLTAREAAQELKSVRTALGNVESSAEDVESAGKVMARALSKAAQDIETDLKQSATAADALGAALGPELAAQVGRSGLEGFVANLKKAGLTAQEIETDADELAAAIKHLDDVGEQMDGVQGGLKKVGTELDDVSTKTDQSRSVMANFAGNTASEMPGVAGAFGPLNMAIGQFSEYAAEGNISMVNLAKTAGPMLGVAVAAELLSKYMKEIAAVKAFNKKEVDSFTDSLKKGENVAQEFKERLAEVGKIEWKMNRLFGGDALDDLNKAGVSVDQFIDAVMGGPEALKLLSDGLQAAGVDSEVLLNITMAAKTQQDNYAQAVKTTAELQKVGLVATEGMARGQRGLSGDTRKAKEAMEGAATATAAMDRAYSDLTTELDNEEAWLGLLDNIDSYNATMKDSEATDRQKQQATLDLKRTMVEYTNSLKEIPQEKRTEVLALIDQGKIDEANWILGVLTADRDVRINPVVGKGASGSFTLVPNSKYAKGTESAAPGLALVGEDGPEVVDMGAGGQKVYTASQSARMLSGGGDNVTIIQVLPHGVRIDDLVTQATRRRNRRNGF